MRTLITPAITILLAQSLFAATPAERQKSVTAITPQLPTGARVLVVDNQDPAANDTNSGDAAAPLRTINQAAQQAAPGDTVLVFAGTYRERIAPKQGGKSDRPILYTAAPGEPVIVKGSELWRPDWKPLSGQPGVYSGALNAALFTDIPNPYRIGISIAGEDKNIVARPVDPQTDRWPRTLGQLFVNGEEYQEVESPAELQRTANTWLTAADGESLLVHFSDAVKTPADCQVEISVRNRIFAPHRRGLGFITVRGFTFEHCANQGPFPQAGALSVRSGHNWIIENNTIRHAKTLGVDCGSETWGVDKLQDTDADQKRIMIGGKHLIAHNVISDNGLCGIAGWNHGGTVIRSNILERNNNLGFVAGLDAGWWEQAAIKMHGFNNGVIEGNLVRDNDAFGIWIDNGYTNARITRNVVVNNQLGGIFLELGKGPGLIDNNVIAYTRGGDGIYCHDASGITIANNLLYYNANFGIWMHVVSERTIGKDKVETSSEKLASNLFIGNFAGAVCLPLTSKRSHDNASDYNAFIDGTWMMTPRESRFQINNNSGRIDLGANQGQPASGESDTARPANDSLTLAQWQQRMGMDLHSEALKMKDKTMLRSRRLNLEFNLTSLPTRAPALADDRLTHDLLGAPIDPQHVLPGPFQNLNVGRNSLYLWPLQDPK